MSTIASLPQRSVTVEPGGEATCEVTVRNGGSVVDEFTVEVLGDASGWSSVDPPVLRLFPDGEETATVTFRPPRAPDPRSGDLPFGLRIASKENPEGSQVEEGILHVNPFTDLFAELIPRTTRGRMRGKQDLAVDNRGNTPVEAAVGAFDPDDVLEFDVRPPEMEVGPGQAAFGAIRIRPNDRHWRGPSLSHPFKVIVEPLGGPAVVVDGTMVQEPTIPPWLPRALKLAAMAAVGLFVLWQTLLKPTIQLTAREAVEEPLNEQAIAIEKLAKAVEASGGGNADGGQEPSGEQPTGAEDGTTPVDAGGGEQPEGGGGGAGEGSSPAGGGRTAGAPFDRRLQAQDAPGGDAGHDSFTVPAGQMLSLTDIVLQNPGGHSGLLRIKRDDAILIEVALQNFRDLDYHFVAPIIFAEGQQVALEVECAAPAPPAEECGAAAYLTGSISPAPPQPSPEPTSTSTATEPSPQPST